MTDRKKFEAMLEALINEDHEAAKDIFHNIVVAKSREIYENLLAEESEEEEFEEAFGDDEEEESDDEEEADSDFGSDDEGDDEGEDDDFGGFGDDEDGEDDEFGGEDDEFGGEDEGGKDGRIADLENDVLDLTDALDELKAEFEQLLAGEENEPEHDDMFGGDDELSGLGDEEGEEDNEFQSMFEYVNKVALPKHGDNGVNNKSIFNKPKYNDMGGVAPKFGGTASGEGTQGGLLNPKTSKLDGGNQNVPGNTKAPKLKPVPKGHGAEKKSTGDNGTNKRSLIPGRK
jgi:hypothetical protein